MLEKNKDYIEFSMWSFMATHKPGQCTDINITGISPEYEVLGVNNPFDIPCDVVVIPKRAFERLQADDQHYRELAKQQEENYKLLLEKTGFTSETDLIDYIHDPSMTSPEDKTLREIIDECEEDYISERDKAEALQTENEQLKKKLEELSPVPGYRDFLKALYPEATEATIEKLAWTTGQLCCGRDLPNALRVDLTYHKALSSARARAIDSLKQDYEAFSKLVGFSSIEELQDYLTNEAECDTLQEAVSKLKDQVKYTCDEWYSANSKNNSWKVAAECNSPKELIEKRETLEKENIDLKKENDEFARKNQELIEKRETLEKEIQVYSRALKDWKEGTGCPSPSAAKTLIENGVTHIVYLNDPLGIIAQWQKATGCDTPGRAEEKLEHYKECVDDARYAVKCAKNYLDNITF